MKLLVDINHPAHVHFFRHLIRKCKAEGHEVVVTASSKDITFQLLDNYNISYISLGSYGHTAMQKLMSVPVMARRMYRIAKKHQPDLMIGLASSRITHAGRLLGIPSYVFTDTEHAKLQIALYRPFASKIITPSAFWSDFGKKHLRYNGFHDLAYLHPEVFQPNPDILKSMELNPEAPYFLVRFISWQATHDVGQRGFSLKGKRKLIALLEGHGRVFISSEGTLPEEFEKYRFKAPPEHMHDFMAFAHLYLGEGGTMATEAAVLGVPSILVNSLDAGVFQSLVQDYGLMQHFKNEEEAQVGVEQLIEHPNLKKEWEEKRRKLIDRSVNLTNWMYDLIVKNQTGDRPV